MKTLRLFVTAVLLLILAGCSVQSSQLSTLMSIVRAPSMDMSGNIWTLEYGDYQAAVYAVNASDATMFSNTIGDHIVFDGWAITDVAILNQNRFQMRLETAASGERKYLRDTLVTRIHLCAPWQREDTINGVLFIQPCEGVNGYTNSILVDSEGAIAEIIQSVDGSSSKLRLIKS